MGQDKFQWVLNRKEQYRTTPIEPIPGYRWSMYEHIRRSFLYKHSKFWKGLDDGSRYFNNLSRPILNVGYRATNIDVKHIEPFVNDDKNYFKSFFVRKYHPKWARDNDLDVFLDELVESYVDYGLALTKNVDDIKPEVVDLTTLAFCDQHEVLAGPLAIEHAYTPSELMAMEKWDANAIDRVLTLCEAQNKNSEGVKVEVYEVHGELPANWLDKDASPYQYIPQIQILAYYKDKDGKKNGITLFANPEPKPIFKLVKRDPIKNRACGFGGVEELFEEQTWTNFAEIKGMKMLETASLSLWQTADKKFRTSNKMSEKEEGEIMIHEEGKPLNLIATPTQNKPLFDATVQRLTQNARTLGSAQDPVLGVPSASGTPFRSVLLQQQEGLSIHAYRRDKIATFVGEIYRDWVLGYLVKEINRGQKFIEELSFDEMQEVSDQLVVNLANKRMVEMVMAGQEPQGGDMEQFKKLARESFMKNKKKFIEVLKDELKDIPIDVHVNVAGRQANLTEDVDKIVNLVRVFMQNPQAAQGMGKQINELLEKSGISPIDWANLTKAAPPEPAPEMAREIPGGIGERSPQEELLAGLVR